MEKRIKFLEARVLELEKTVARLLASNSFKLSEFTILHEPKKVLDIQISDSFVNGLEEELDEFETNEEFMKHKGFTTQEEMDAYVDSRRQWTFNIHYGALYYTRIIDNKAEADDFKTRLFKWRSGEI